MDTNDWKLFRIPRERRPKELRLELGGLQCALGFLRTEIRSQNSGARSQEPGVTGVAELGNDLIQVEEPWNDRLTFEVKFSSWMPIVLNFSATARSAERQLLLKSSRGMPAGCS
jgi:hypothetical protein